MLNESVSVVAQVSGAGTQPWADAPLSQSVSESDAARFSGLLAGTPAAPATPVSPVTSIEPAASQSVGTQPFSGSAFGDAILRTMEAASNSYSAKTSRLEEMMKNPSAEWTAHDMLSLQFDMMGASFQVETISKGLSKVGQHIDQLTKLQ